MSEIQPSCHSCGCPYPNRDIEEWKNWGEISFTRNKDTYPYRQHHRDYEYLCCDCYNYVLSEYKTIIKGRRK